MSELATLYCVACAKEVEAQALFGDSIYPHRPDLYGKTFLQCPHCGNYVGTHQDGRPLGTIPTPELRAMRNKVHAVIDEFWLPERNRGKRKRLYKALSNFLGREYHTGELNSIEECEVCKQELDELIKEIENETILNTRADRQAD